MASLVLEEEASGLAWADGVLDEGNDDGEPRDSVKVVSTTGRGGESSGTERTAAVIGPDSTVVEDTDVATRVEVDAVVVPNVELDVDVGVIEAFEQTAKKRNSDWEDIFSLEQNGVWQPWVNQASNKVSN